MGVSIGSRDPVGALPSVGSHAGTKAMDHGAIGAAGGGALGLVVGVGVGLKKSSPVLAPLLLTAAGAVAGGLVTGGIGASAALGQSFLQPTNERQSTIAAGVLPTAIGAVMGGVATIGTNKFVAAAGVAAGAAAGLGIDVGLSKLEARGVSLSAQLD